MLRLGTVNFFAINKKIEGILSKPENYKAVKAISHLVKANTFEDEEKEEYFNDFDAIDSYF